MPANLPIPNFSIRGFRGIDSLELGMLGRVNLLVGKNNVGKSTVLEALRLFAARGSYAAVSELLGERGEIDQPAEERRRRPFPLEAAAALFTGWPDLRKKRESPLMRLGAGNETLDFDIVVHRVGDDVNSMRTLAEDEAFPDEEEGYVPVLRVSRAGKPVRDIYFESGFADSQPGLVTRRHGADDPIGCAFFGSKGLDDAAVARLWDRVALTAAEDAVLQLLGVFRPRIEKISFVEKTGNGTAGSRKGILRREGRPQPEPLRSMGDGVSRLLGIALTLLNARGGIVLLDEFEHCLHYSTQERVWEFVIRTARELDLQVFATTHSRDCVTAFARAAAAAKDDEGVLTRLVRRKQRMEADQFTEEDMAVVIRDWIEVR